MGFSVSGDNASTNSVDSAAIQDGSILSVDMAPQQVTTDKLANGAVTTAKMGSGQVTTDKLGAGAVTTAKVEDGAITAAKLDGGVAMANTPDGSILRAKLAADIIDATKLADNAVGVEHISTAAVGTDELAADAVTEAKIANGAVREEHIANQAVTVDKLAPGAVDAAATGNGAVTAPKFASAQIFTVAGSIVASAARDVIYTGSTGVSLTLPTAAAGMQFRIMCARSAAGGILLAKQAGDAFGAGSTTVEMSNGETVDAICVATGTWLIVRRGGATVAATNTTSDSATGDRDVLSLAVRGDGITPMRLSAQGIMAGTGFMYGQLRDGAGGTGAVLDGFPVNLSGGGGPVALEAVVAPFTGARTFYLRQVGAGGNFQGATNRKTVLRVDWAPGALAS